MGLFRCHNPKCSERPGVPSDFEAALPVCPRCGLDRRKPAEAQFIDVLVAVHFDPPHPLLPGRGLNVLACQTGIPVFGRSATGVPAAVTCPACRRTEAFKKLAPENPAFEVFDIPKEHRPEARVEGGCCG